MAMLMLEWCPADPTTAGVVPASRGTGDSHDPAEECEVSDLGKLSFGAQDWSCKRQDAGCWMEDPGGRMTSWHSPPAGSCCVAFHPGQDEQPKLSPPIVAAG